LSVRRKVKKIADAAKARAKAERGIELSSQAGLHHPYVFNSYRVRAQRAYLCRSPKERKALAGFFGEALGKDAETHYIQPVLEVSLDDQVVEAAFRIHPLAWWDGEHLKKRTADAAGREAWCQLLNALPPGFGLKLHDWRKVYWAQSVRPHELVELFHAYTPGEHWLHLVRELPREDAVALGADAPRWLVDSLVALLDVYRSVLWQP
jgi:hypothetical protein